MIDGEGRDDSILTQGDGDRNASGVSRNEEHIHVEDSQNVEAKNRTIIEVVPDVDDLSIFQDTQIGTGEQNISNQ